MNLNPKQEEAKNKIDWPLLIIAWAWSWKTATLAARVEYMIREQEILSSSIIMVTFTNKAAGEMRERVANTLWLNTPKNLFSNKNFPLIWTFHSIWIFILKEVLSKYDSEELWIWLKKDFVIYDETDKLSVLRWIIKDDLKLDEKTYPARQIAFYISNAKNSLVTAKWYESLVDSALKEVVKDVYYNYEEKLRSNNAVDFDDILLKTLLALKIPTILGFYQEKYKYIMVDEYQDTNKPQYEIVKLLASKYENLAVVGDDSQSIYSWRGADMQNILNFKKDYPNAEIIKLEQNYRSTSNIIKAANEVIKNNKSWITKELWTENNIWKKINYIKAPDDKLEASIISKIIKENSSSEHSTTGEGVATKSWSYSDNLILYRTNWQSRMIEEALIVAQIPYRVVWWLKFYDRKEIKDMLAYLKSIYNPNDIVSIKRIINTPTRKIWAKTIEILDSYKERFWLSYLQIFENIDEVEDLRAWAKESIKIFRDLLNKLISLSKKIEVSHLIKEIIELTDYKEYLRENFSKEEYESKIDNLVELENVSSEYNWIEPRESLSQFLEEVALITDLDKKDNREEYVTLMTIHTAKWLEQKRVFIAWAEEWIFPHVRSLQDNFQLEEERRLMYVAITRAREELYISRTLERFYFWEYMKNPESRFIEEIPKNFIEDYDITRHFPASNWSSFFSSLSNTIIDTDTTSKVIKKPKVSNDISSFSMWDRVEHHKFWIWIITSLDWELAEIAFRWAWIKKMNIRIAPVKRM